MPGTFSKASRPRRPGAYVNYEGATNPRILPSQGSVVAVAFTHNWGPLKQATLVGSNDEALGIFGDPAVPTDGEIALRGAFQGEGILGRGGAGGVIAYRMGGATAAKATKTFQNTTPAAALKVDARYEGTRGNDFRITIQASATAGMNDFIVLDGALEKERYLYAPTDLAGLAAAVNAVSKWVHLTVLINGVALGLPQSAVALTGGDDGATLTAADWTAYLAAMEVERYSILAPANLTDSSIRATVVAWVQAQNKAGRRQTLVLGGAAGESVAVAITRSQAINDPNVINVGGGTAVDSIFGNLSTAQLAPRIAGILAARGETKSLTFARLAGITALAGGATNVEIDAAFNAGLVVLSRDTSVPEAPVKIEKGLTTYATQTDPAKPVSVFSNPKYVRTMQNIENESVALGEQPGAIGELGVNGATRNYLKGEIGATILAPRVPINAIREGWTIDVDTDPAPSDDDEFLAYRLGLRFGRIAEQIYLTIQAG